MISHRQLPAEEWHRLRGLGPFPTDAALNPDHWRVLVAEEAGEIVGFTCLYETVHNDPWWVREDHRKNPTLLRGLLREMFTVLREYDVQFVHAVVPDLLADQQALVKRFGFEEAPGKLYILDTRST